MKTIRITLLAGALVALTSPAAAQPEPPARRGGGEVTRDQALARAEQRFQRLDTNRDGRVTAEELRLRAQSRLAARGERRAERLTQRFERLDTDRNGQLSREEFAQRREVRGERGSRRGMRGMRTPRGGAMAMRLLGQDGSITADEFRAHALERFERIDANRDGRISVEERRDRRERFSDGRRGPPPSPQQD